LKAQFDRKFVYEYIDTARPEGQTWTKIGENLNEHLNLDLDESAYRKAYTEYSRGRVDALPDKEFEKLMEEKRRINLAKRYLSYEKSANFDAIRDITIKSILNEQAREAIRNSAPKLTFAEDVSAWADDGEEEYVFTLSDFHYNGDADMLLVLERVYAHIRLKQQELGFKKIKLLELGDTFDGGALRVSQLMAIKKGMVFQVIDIAKAYANLINRLSEDMLVDFYCVTSSNHTQLRPLGTKQNQLVEEDLMQVFAEFIELSTELNDRVTVSKGTDLYFDVCGYDVFASHGHLVRNKEGYLQKVAYNRGINIDYGLMGHYHHYREITLYSAETHNKKIFVVPSLNPNISNFETDRDLSSKAGFILQVFNKTRGHRYTEELFI